MGLSLTVFCLVIAALVQAFEDLLQDNKTGLETGTFNSGTD